MKNIEQCRQDFKDHFQHLGNNPDFIFNWFIPLISEVKGTVSEAVIEAEARRLYPKRDIHRHAFKKGVKFRELLSLTSSKKESDEDRIKKLAYSTLEFPETKSPASINKAEVVGFGEFLKKYHSIKWVNDLTTSELHSLYLKTKGQIFKCKCGYATSNSTEWCYHADSCIK